jgi:hypothetical protein
MPRLTLLALVAALALPGSARAHEDELDDDWGYIDPGPAAADVDVYVDGGEPEASVTFETFEENLAPHGEWVAVSGYGRVWRPRHVHSGWRPYYDGSWQWTDEGWLWVSAEPWGWATYHYGRWAYEPFYGWVWVPGYQWAPAWVSWRVSADFIGWAPLGPGLSVHVTSYPAIYDRWVFVPCNRFVAAPVPTHAYVGPHVRGVWGGTQPAPPRASVLGSRAPAWGGPARPFIERRVGRVLTPVRVQPVATPQAMAAPRRAGVVPVFRPEVARPLGARGALAAPSRSAVAPSRGEGGGGRGAVRSAPVPGAEPARPSAAAPAPAPRGNGGRAAAPESPGGAVAPRPSWGGGAPAQRSAPAQRGTPSAAPAAPAPRAAPAAPSRGRGGGAESGSHADGEGRGGGGRSGAFAPAPSRGGGDRAGGERGGGGRGGGGRPGGGHSGSLAPQRS